MTESSNANTELAQRCTASDTMLEEQATAIRDHADSFIRGDTGRELHARALLLLDQVRTLVAWTEPADEAVAR